LSIGTPSTTNNGWLLPVKVVSPYYYTRTRKAPPDPVTRTPATLPAS
jgi:hypothetical protein